MSIPGTSKVGDPGIVRFTLAVGVPGFNPFVPPTPAAEDVAEALTEVALGPIAAVVSGLLFQVNWLITWLRPNKAATNNTVVSKVVFIKSD